MLRSLASSLPSPVIRWLGALQFRHPWTARALRALASAVASGEGVISRGPGSGLRIDATGRNAGYVLGTSDEREQVWLAGELTDGGGFYDIGANIGFFTLLAARLVGPSGSVVAFEPWPENAAQLRRNVALNAFSHVTVVPAAVSAASGRSRFGGAPTEAGRRHTSRLLDAETPARGGVDVAVVTVDEWRSEHAAPPPTVVKIDVEGAEVEVLRGAHATIADHLPVMLVEVHWDGELFVEYVKETIVPLGYGLETIDGLGPPADLNRWHAVLRPRDRSGPSAARARDRPPRRTRPSGRGPGPRRA